MRQVAVWFLLWLIPRFLQYKLLTYAICNILPVSQLAWYKGKVLKVEVRNSKQQQQWRLYYDGQQFFPTDAAADLNLTFSLRGLSERIKRITSVSLRNSSFLSACRGYLGACGVLCRYSRYYIQLYRKYFSLLGRPHKGDRYSTCIMSLIRARDFYVISNDSRFDFYYYTRMVGLSFTHRDEAIVYYIMYGRMLNSDPSPYFSTFRYLCQNPDLHELTMLPFTHYIHCGEKEGRSVT